MILFGNKQNSLIFLFFFSFSRMEIPVYNLGECTPGLTSCHHFGLSPSVPLVDTLLSSHNAFNISKILHVLRENENKGNEEEPTTKGCM